MRSLTPEYLDAIRFNADQASTLQAVGECRGKQTLFARQTPEILESLRETAIIESAASSNRLEGITAPLKRIVAVVTKPTAAKNRSEQEIAGYRDALTLIHDSHGASYLSTTFVLQLHRTIYRYLPQPGGQWKTVDNEIVERASDGAIKRIRFTPVSAVETPVAMEALVGQYRHAIEFRRAEPLIVIPLTVLDFLCIHPFADGNGRVSRLLALLLLYRFDYQVGRYISLERVFEESKETYYEALEASSQGWHGGRHDPYPWLNYFWGVLLRAYREFEERVGTIRTTRGSKTEQVRRAVERRTGPFAISDLEIDCPRVSRDMIRRVLRQLRDEGVIAVQGKGRGAKWHRAARSSGPRASEPRP